VKHVTVIVANPKAPSVRLRLASLQPFAQAAGLSLNFGVLPRRPEWYRVWRLRRAFRSSQLLLFSKLKLLLGEDALVRRWCSLWVLDVDDAVMVGKPKRHGEPPDEAWWRKRRFARMVRSCSLTVAGSQTLKGMIEPLGGTVVVWPTPVDLRRYPQAQPGREGEVSLAWIGLGKNLRYLEDLCSVLRQLAQEHSFRLKVISNQLPQLPGVPMDFLPWSEEKEGEHLASCHLGLAPLTDDLWTRGKGAYRCIQYAAAGLPTVASPVGANREVVVPGETGLWAASPQEWLAALRQLLENPPLRERLGQRARQRASRHYDLALLAPRYVQWLLALLALPSRGQAKDEQKALPIGETLHHQRQAR
jgi:glycosyltransferase involved in cell wall biosynthesis